MSNTVLRPSENYKEKEVEIRVELLQEILKSQNPDYDLLHREMARVIIAMYGEISTLGGVRNELARLTQRLLLFMDDQLDARIARQRQEADRAKTEYERSNQAMSDSQKMQALLKNDIVKNPIIPPAPPKKLTFPEWFRDRVAPGLLDKFVTIAIVAIAIVLWQAFKTAVNAP